jgi:hypothetical protein
LKHLVHIATLEFNRTRKKPIRFGFQENYYGHRQSNHR